MTESPSASPQREDGHIDIANTIVEEFCRFRIPGREWQVLWSVLRQTWGYVIKDEKGQYKRDKRGNVLKKKIDCIPVRTISQMTGIRFQACHDLLNSLADHNIIKKHVLLKGDTKSISYGFNKHFHEWKPYPKRGTVPQKGDGVYPNRGTKASPKRGTSKEIKKYIKKNLPSEALRLSEVLAELILENNPKNPHLIPEKREASIHRWAEDIDKLQRLDKQTWEDIEAVIRWCQKDTFWQDNILSGQTLRKKFQQLFPKMKKANKQPPPSTDAAGQPLRVLP